MPHSVHSDRLLKTVCFLVAASTIACGRKTGNTESVLLKETARLLQQASQRANDTIPDGVLNRTRCLVVIPALSGAIDRRPGVFSCRGTSSAWGTPAFITFDEIAPAKHTDILIFVLTDPAVQALRSGRLRIRPQKNAQPPLVSTTPLPNQMELSSEMLVYEYAAPVFSASRAEGSIAAELDNQSQIHIHDQGKVSDKVSEQYLSSIESFFNTIRPTGIVLHHTAILPSEIAPPRSRRAVDKYHEARGFEIKCSGRVYHEAYHFLILPDGRVQRGRPETCQGAHAEGYNSYLGISIVGDFSSEDNPHGEKGPIKPTEKQIDSLVQLCRKLKDQYNIPLHHIVRHSDTSSTRCPGDRFPFSFLLQQIETSAATDARRESR